MTKKAEAAKYSADQILSSKRFAPQEQDFLRALLQEGETYTLDDAAAMLDQYLKQEAK